MSTATRVTARLLGLGPRRTQHVHADLDIPVPMADGVTLFANRWYPDGGEAAPIVLMRSPYGRAGYVGTIGQLFAERGYQAVIVSCRGTFSSGGDFLPFRNERADGLATWEWLERQPWFTPRVGTWGASYLGICQWAAADPAPPWLRAMATAITTAESGTATVQPGGGFALESMLRWACENSLPPVEGIRGIRRRHRELEAGLARGEQTLPLGAGPAAAVGRPVPFYEQWLEHGPGDPWWDATDFRGSVPGLAAPVSMVAGWYDMFLPHQLRDFVALQEAGRSPRITIGPWAHGDVGLFRPLLGDAFEWLDAHLLDAPLPQRRAVRLRLLGSRRWVEYDTWPPSPGETTWYLHAGGGLAASAPTGDGSPDGGGDSFVYDPAEPTPGVGGPSLAPGNRGAKDQRARAARADVLTYTSAPLRRDTTYVGPLTARLQLTSSTAYGDVHVTLCDVAPRGTVTSISTGIARFAGIEPGAPTEVTVEMWPLGCTFRAGHRLAVHVAGGAHPTYARHLGTGEPASTATEWVASRRTVFGDAGRPSRLVIGGTAQ